MTVAHDLAGADVSAIPSKTYTGKALKPKPTVKYGGTTLKLGTDYTVTYKSNKNVGTATATITGKGSYAGTVTTTFNIVKATNNKVKVAKTSVSKTLKASSLKKKAGTVALPKATATYGTAKWKVVTADAKKALTLKGGKVLVKKGAKKGTYTVKLKANVAKTKNYNAASSKTVTVTMRVK